MTPPALDRRSPADESGPPADTFEIRSSDDVFRFRGAVRAAARELGMGSFAQTKVATAAGELARNQVVHAGGGTSTLTILGEQGRKGIELIFQDHGPGIPSLSEALAGGFTTGNGLGLGLSGARQLVDEFEIRADDGTWIRVVMWSR